MPPEKKRSKKAVPGKRVLRVSQKKPIENVYEKSKHRKKPAK
jgi:hypothetical protein